MKNLTKLRETSNQNAKAWMYAVRLEDMINNTYTDLMNGFNIQCIGDILKSSNCWFDLSEENCNIEGVRERIRDRLGKPGWK